MSKKTSPPDKVIKDAKKFVTRHDKVIAGISVAYMAFICIFMIIHRIWFSPDQFFIFAVIGSLFLGRARMFLMDWGPFVILFLGYEFLRGLVPLVSSHVHIFPMIRADELLFGFIPTVKFQQWLYHPPTLHWYDYVAVTLYICHFVTPMLVGFVLWIKDRPFFKDYTLGLLILSYASFITYIAFPAMPPWMASGEGYLPPLQEVTGVVMAHFLPAPGQVPTIYSLVRGNPVAAVPSLHAAFPLLILLFVFKRSRKVGLLFVPYVLGVWFAVVYLGEHYVSDVLAGAVYAVLAYLLVQKKSEILSWFKSVPVYLRV